MDGGFGGAGGFGSDVGGGGGAWTAFNTEGEGGDGGGGGFPNTVMVGADEEGDGEKPGQDSGFALFDDESAPPHASHAAALPTGIDNKPLEVCTPSLLWCSGRLFSSSF